MWQIFLDEALQKHYPDRDIDDLSPEEQKVLTKHVIYLYVKAVKIHMNLRRDKLHKQIQNLKRKRMSDEDSEDEAFQQAYKKFKPRIEQQIKKLKRKRMYIR